MSKRRAALVGVACALCVAGAIGVFYALVHDAAMDADVRPGPPLVIAALSASAIAGLAGAMISRRVDVTPAAPSHEPPPPDRFEAVVNNMDVAVFAVDERGLITVTNPALAEMFGLSGSPVGRHFEEAIPVAKLHDTVAEALDGRSSRVEVDLPGKRRVAVVYASPQGPGDGAAVVLRDISAIRHLERVRRDFVANVSHELRTPVSVIQANAETLLEGALEDPVHARVFIQAIGRHAARMTRIIQGLLDLAGLEAGQRGLAREPVNVRAAVLRAVDLVGQSADDGRVDVAIHVEGDARVLGDTKGLDQVLSNLLENAVKYAGDDGHIEVHGHVEGRIYRLEVADDGPGIKEKHRLRVFERFYRVDKGRSRDKGGTGLGLAIVKHLVLAMGGAVGVEPGEPTGSVFWVTLPVATSAQTEITGPR